MEVKNCSLAENGIAMLPDAVTSRGTKHLEELIRLYQNDHQAASIFCVQRTDYTTFKAAATIDPMYADTLNKAIHYGVKAFVYQAHVSPQVITITSKIPFLTIH